MKLNFLTSFEVSNCFEVSNRFDISSCFDNQSFVLNLAAVPVASKQTSSFEAASTGWELLAEEKLHFCFYFVDCTRQGDYGEMCTLVTCSGCWVNYSWLVKKLKTNLI